MEEKKEIKISLSTALLIIALIIITLLSIYIYIISNKYNSIREATNVPENNNNITSEQYSDSKDEISHNNNQNNTNNNISTSDNKENKFVQFDTEFFKLSDISKEYIECTDIEEYKEFSCDLDGDSIQDIVTIERTEKGDYGTFIFKVNKKEFARHSDKPEIYIVDLNKNDNTMEIVIYDQGSSDDPNYTIYAKKDEEMINLKNIEGYPLKCDTKGTIIISDNYNGQTIPEIFFTYYFIKNNKIEEKYVNAEDLKNVDIRISYEDMRISYLYFSEDYKNLDKFRKEGNLSEDNLKDFNIEKLDSEITFKILNFETTKYENGLIDRKIKVTLSDGREGYIFNIQWAD